MGILVFLRVCMVEFVIPTVTPKAGVFLSELGRFQTCWMR